jgi:class 3 adenylate cyclase/tetratricopeptide (TPR) repeat protein
MRCEGCETENPHDARSCAVCGAPLKSASAPAAPRSAEPSPPGAAAEGERRFVTVMFADVSGFTALGERMDPEALRGLMTACFDHLVPVIRKHDGAIDKFIGDEIMVLFGAPLAHENDPERALRCALEMKDALSAFNAREGSELDIHFGINSGLVFAGGIGPTGRQDYSVMGDAVNLASRLEGESLAGEVLVGPETHRLTEHLFEFADAGSLRLHGKKDTVHAFRLVGALEAYAARLRPGSGGMGSALVGRKAEMGVFLDFFDRLAGGAGGVISVFAEAGMGKSRLVAEARRQATERGITWLEGHTLSMGEGVSYGPLLEVIQSDMGIELDDKEPERWIQLERRMNQVLSGEAVDLLPYVATFLNLTVPKELEDRVKYLDGEGMGQQIFRSMRRYFGRLAEEHPLVLVFEDVHWLDGSSLALLEHLLPLAAEQPLVICCVGRPEADSPAARLRDILPHSGAPHAEIDLPPLSDEESVELVRNLVGLADFTPGLRLSILARADGNPFFLEEVVRALIDLGGIVREDGGWRFAAQAEDLPVPDTLKGVIMARIDRLDEDLRRVLRLASAVGRSFLYRVLRELARVDETLDEELEALQGLTLIREKTRAPELEYMFKHALVQEATYESILLERRRELHGQVGACIERLFADGLDEFYPILAYHYSRAEDWAKAHEYLSKAADRAGRIAADTEALEHYRRALAAYGRAFGDSWDPVDRARFRRKMGEAHYRLGEHGQAQEHFVEALRALGAPLPGSRPGLYLAICREAFRQAAHRLLPSVFRWGRRVDEGVAVERCLLYGVLASMDLFGNTERYVLDSLLSLNLAESHGIDDGAAIGLGGAALSLLVFRAPGLARSYVKRLTGLAARTDQPLHRGLSWMGLTHYENTTGRFQAALEHADLAAEAYYRAGDMRQAAIAVCVSTDDLLYLGRAEECLARARRVVALAEEAGDPLTTAYGWASLGEALDPLGAFSEADVFLTRALDSPALEASGDKIVLLHFAGNLAHCRLRADRMEEARAILDQYKGLSEKLEDFHVYHQSVYWTSAAEVAVASAERAETAERSVALARARAACRLALGQGRWGPGALASAYRSQGTYEWLRGRHGRAQRWWERSIAISDRLGSRFELGCTQLEMGRRLTDGALLRQAEKTFVAVGAEFDLRVTRELLEAVALD